MSDRKSHHSRTWNSQAVPGGPSSKSPVVEARRRKPHKPSQAWLAPLAVFATLAMFTRSGDPPAASTESNTSGRDRTPVLAGHSVPGFDGVPTTPVTILPGMHGAYDAMLVADPDQSRLTPEIQQRILDAVERQLSNPVRLGQTALIPVMEGQLPRRQNIPLEGATATPPSEQAIPYDQRGVHLGG